MLAFLVKIKGREILFDTGLPDGRIAAELKKNGRTAGDVKTILLTHLHRDHYGGLVLGRRKERRKCDSCPCTVCRQSA